MDTNRDKQDLSNSSNALSKAEKLKKRQEQLAAWKLKKEKESKIKATGDLSVEKKVESGKASLDDKEKTKLGQQRIEAWKKKRLQQQETASNSNNGGISSENAVKTSFGVKIKKPQNVLVNFGKSKRQLFEEDDPSDVRVRPVFKKPTLAAEENTANKDAEEEEEDLDKYIESLENAERPAESIDIKSKALHNIEQFDDGEDDDEELSNEEERDSRLLSSKLLKLQNKEKDLNVVDYDSVSYKDFRKDFYKVPLELQNLSEESVNELRAKTGKIRVRGVNCPAPISKWSHLGLPSIIMSTIEEDLKYIKPSPIQSQALPCIMSGRDVIAVAKTGSGKTLSFIIPLLRHIQDQPPLEKGDGPIGLIMSPTRELTLQIYKELSLFTKKINISVSCCYGGSSIETQIADLKRGAHVVVGTPGRIIDLLAANSGRVTNLRRVTYVVLDEADRMFDMGFEPQVNKIFTQIRSERQTVLFSATFPRKMEFLAKKILNNPIEIIVGGISVVASEITQKVELFESENEEGLMQKKTERLLTILGSFVKENPNKKVLIFVEKQTAADDLLVKILSSKHAALAIHGGKEQLDRKHAIKTFASPSSGVDILIATSIAARGLDVKGLDLVINFDAANHMEDYVHRVGRTGRAGNKGVAITFVNSDQERQIYDLLKAMKASKVPETDIPAALLEISHKFEEQVKTGKEKSSYGFGGKGLEKLQGMRDTNRDIQRKVFADDPNVSQKDASDNASSAASSRNTLDTSAGKKDSSDVLPDFDIIEGRAPETSGPDMSKFHSRITINDLPQRARWHVVNRDSLSKIIESTSTSITNKGQFYPPNTKVPKPSGSTPPPPKLYLLVEGLTESSVRQANNLIRQKMLEGIELVAKDDFKAPAGKYSV